MAKSKSFFGLRRGSTKSLTFAVQNGVQITKDRVTDIKNPRSAQQMKQRCFLKTTALGYACMKAIVDHSFEGYSYGSMSMRQFMKLNTPLVMNSAGDSKPSFGYAAYGDSTPNMGKFIISDGKLSPVPSSAVTLKFEENTLLVTYNGGGGSTSELAASLGCNLGDIATLCALCQNTAGDVKFIWLRLILPDENVAISAESVKFESDIRFSVSYGSNLIASITFDEVDNINSQSAALYGVIRSRKSDMTWQRSRTVLNLSVGAVRFLDDYTSALLSYPTGEPYILNGDDTTDNETKPLPTFSVVVANSTTAVISGEGSFSEGTNVTLTASSIPVGQIAKWDGVPDGSGSTITKSGNTISFVMPANDVNISFSLETVELFSIINPTDLDAIGAEVSPYEDITEGEEVTFSRTTSEEMTGYTSTYLANASTDEKWKDIPYELSSGDRLYTWVINMPPFNLKVVLVPEG
ncbi:MAG: hypothetical protein ACI35P_12235 [Bacillus sp. (in: firmicutes)]